jgi:hypothetical protein
MEETTVVSGKLEESLRHEIESYIEGRLGGVKQEIAELQSRLNEALTQLLDRQSEVHLDGSVTASIMEHLKAAHDEGIDLAASESARAKASSDMAIVKAAVTEMGEQTSQGEILKTLVNRAASFAPRVAFFAIKGDKAIGWRARGFEGSVGDNAVQQISIPLTGDNLLSEVARTRTTWSGGAHTQSENHVLLNRLGQESPPERVVSIPLNVRKRAVAVLYADSGSLDSEAINLEALETLVQMSGMCVDLLAAQAPAKAPAAQPEPPQEATPETVVSSYAPEREYAAPEYVAQADTAVEAAPVEEVAAEVVAEPVPADVVADIVEAEVESAPEPVEAEAVPSIDVSAPGAPRRRYGSDVELPVAVSGEEERRLHVDARRFARLLVSEIKLYNEQKVQEGRSQSDLYDRLREYIDRSRDMYDKRVKPEVAQSYDYFHHELVNTLAEGDAGKLGNAYPGATVSA